VTIQSQPTRAVILLVDDERVVLESLKNQLRNLFGRRFRYEAAENVADAWEVLDDLGNDGVDVVLIVSDWLMPDTKGDVFLTEVRARFPRTARVMLTGQADPDAIERAYKEAAVVRVLSKPWTEAELKETVEMCSPTSETDRP
jgi:CheY-like chemotaxis protein